MLEITTHSWSGVICDPNTDFYPRTVIKCAEAIVVYCLDHSCYDRKSPGILLLGEN